MRKEGLNLNNMVQALLSMGPSHLKYEIEYKLYIYIYFLINCLGGAVKDYATVCVIHKLYIY